MADGLYVAILTDTGGFRFFQHHGRGAPCGGRAGGAGGLSEGLHKQVYGTAPLRRLRLLAASLPTVQSEDGVAWIVVPRDAFEELGATSRTWRASSTSPVAGGGGGGPPLPEHRGRGGEDSPSVPTGRWM